MLAALILMSWTLIFFKGNISLVSLCFSVQFLYTYAGRCDLQSKFPTWGDLWNKILPKVKPALEEFSITSCKNQLFEENKHFECIFYGTKVQVKTWLQACLTKLKKTPKTRIFAYDRFFMNFLKTLIFHIFRYFRKSSAAHTKVIVCVLFHVNMSDQI